MMMNFSLANTTNSYLMTTNTTSLDTENNTKIDFVKIISSVIASVGMVSNLTVVVAFLNHKKFRRKIPNMFIINQVSQSNIKVHLFLSFVLLSEK